MTIEEIHKEIVGCCINDEAATEATGRILRLFGVGSSVACPKCKGEGWYGDHAPNCQKEDGTCSEHNCPIQVECAECYATGKIRPEQAIELHKPIELHKQDAADDLPF